MIKAWIVAAGILASALLWSGCEDVTKNEWEFRNVSSHTVTVSADADKGQTWNTFILARDQRHKIKIRDSRIYYRYSPSNRVYSTDEGGGKITFRNR